MDCFSTKLEPFSRTRRANSVERIKRKFENTMHPSFLTKSDQRTTTQPEIDTQTGNPEHGVIIRSNINTPNIVAVAQEKSLKKTRKKLQNPRKKEKKTRSHFTLHRCKKGNDRNKKTNYLQRANSWAIKHADEKREYQNHDPRLLRSRLVPDCVEKLERIRTNWSREMIKAVDDLRRRNQPEKKLNFF